MESLPLEYVACPFLAGAVGLFGADGLRLVVVRFALIGTIVSALLITAAGVGAPTPLSADDMVVRATIVFTFTLIGAASTVAASVYLRWVRRVFRDAEARIDQSHAARPVPSNAE